VFCKLHQHFTEVKVLVLMLGNDAMAYRVRGVALALFTEVILKTCVTGNAAAYKPYSCVRSNSTCMK